MWIMNENVSGSSLILWWFLYTSNFYFLLYIIDFSSISSENKNLILGLALTDNLWWMSYQKQLESALILL